MQWYSLIETDLAGSQVKFCPHGRFLGLILDEDLKFAEHIRYISKQKSKAVGIFYKLYHFIPQNTLVALYYIYAYPYLLYWNVVGGGTFQSDLLPLTFVQKKLIRIITDENYLAHINRFFKWHSQVVDLHGYYLEICMYKLFFLEIFTMIMDLAQAVSLTCIHFFRDYL